MKKLFVYLMAIVLVFGIFAFGGKTVEAKKKKLYVHNGDYDIDLNIKRIKKAKKYKIYRAMCPNSKKQPTKKKFKKYKTVSYEDLCTIYDTSGYKYNFEDKSVKPIMNYYYYVKAISKKGKVIYNTYKKKKNPHGKMKQETPYLSRVTGFSRLPNNKNGVLLECDIPLLEHGEKLIVYRKEKGDSKFTKINWVANCGYVNDLTTTLGKTYIYKARGYVKVGKKKYYTKYTKEVEVTHYLYHPKYTIKSLTKSGLYTGSYELDVVFEISNNDILNADTRIFGKTLDKYYAGLYHAKRKNPDTGNVEEKDYFAIFTEYSLDGNQWASIPNQGIVLPDFGKTYLKARITKMNHEYEPEILYGGDDQNFIESYFVSANTLGNDIYAYNGITNIRMDLLQKQN